MTTPRGSLGAAELDVLTYVTDDFPVSVRDVMNGLAPTHRYARTTVLTVLERLRKKGFLTRERMDGVNRYRPSFSQRRLMNSVVGRFVHEMLDGSVLPLLTYLANAGRLTSDEVRAVKEMIQRLAAESRTTNDKLVR